MDEMLIEVARLLGMPADAAGRFVALRPGVRTSAVLASPEGAPHRFAEHAPRVVVKLYKGDGRSEGARRYRDYHDDWFARLPALDEHPLVQRSLEAGLSPEVAPGIGPYAIMQYIEGEELAPVLDDRRLAPDSAKAALRDILEGIWVPLWAAGLRFKDCHPGNFVLTPEGRVVMIDTEQMRRAVEEQLRRPDEWSARDAHEQQGLRRLSGLVRRIVLAADPTFRVAPTGRVLDAAIAKHALRERLTALGRGGEGVQAEAVEAVRAFLETLTRDGVLR